MLGKRLGERGGGTAVAPGRRPLEDAIDLQQVRVLFQPVVRLADGVTVGYEALARLGQRADPPGPWFKLARELGLGVDLELTCLAAIAELGLPPGDALLFVNVGADALVHPRMAELCGPLADRLVVELTEHDEVLDYAPLRPALERWSARGVRLAVDDTGAGYSSLRHVLELAPHFLKLDQSVIEGLDDHASRRALVAALVTFADEVGTTVIAEGVERWEEAQALREAGVHLAQGFVFGRPDVPWRPAGWPSEEEGGELARRLGAARDLTRACELVCTHLADRAPLMPSAYVERDGFLRCVAQRGFWQVLDGIPATTGLRGRCIRNGETIVVDDVNQDPDYLHAVPGLQACCAVPLRERGEVVGVLTIESPVPFAIGDVAAVVEAAAVLSEWMDRRGSQPAETPLERLGRKAKTMAGLDDGKAVEEELVRLACEVSGMSSAVLIRPGPLGMLERRAARGPLAMAFYSLSTAELHRLREWVRPVSSFYTSADASGRTLPATEKLRTAGVVSVAAVPVRSLRGEDVGLLAVADAEAIRIGTHDIEALELLVAEAAQAFDLALTIDELKDRAARDPLTGLGNHRAFHDAMRERHAGGGPFAVVMADLDGFKGINDTHGHMEGDRALREVAALMAQALRGEDRMFRIGGDEFAAVLGVPDLMTATAIGERLAQAADPALRRYGAGVSVGVAMTVAGEAVGDLVARADAALYDLKRRR